MKAFEIFNQNEQVNMVMAHTTPEQFRAYIEDEREKTWRTALEWVLSKVPESNSDGSLITYINEELTECSSCSDTGIKHCMPKGGNTIVIKGFDIPCPDCQKPEQVIEPVCKTCGKGKDFKFCSNPFHLEPAMRNKLENKANKFFQQKPESELVQEIKDLLISEIADRTWINFATELLKKALDRLASAEKENREAWEQVHDLAALNGKYHEQIDCDCDPIEYSDKC